MEPEQSIRTTTEEETRALGKRLGARLLPPCILLLEGQLGAGKTAFTRGLAEGLGVSDSSVVRSPTFSLVNEYASDRVKIYHIDLYRLDTLQDLYSIGLEEILEEDAVIVIEWAEKLRLPVSQPIRIHLEVEPDRSRRITICGLSLEE